MTESLAESNLAAGSPGSPNSAPSSSDGVPPSGQVAGSDESLQARLAKMESLVRALQGEKDKGIHKVQNEVTGLKETLAKYEKLRSKGMEPGEAMDEIENGSSIRDQIRALQETVTRLASGQGVGNSAAGPSAAAQVFAGKGLDVNDPDVAIALSELVGVSDQEKIELAAYKVKERKSNQPNPTKAQGSALNSNEPPGPNLEALKREYDEVVKQYRGNPNAIANLKAQYRKKGLANLW